MAMKMRQSLAEFERAFVEEAWDERDRREALRRQAAARSRHRRIERQHKRGSWRFAALVLMLIATAVAVTIAMFETLYIVMG
jgi:anti-sigma-K factor RskA